MLTPCKLSVYVTWKQTLVPSLVMPSLNDDLIILIGCQPPCFPSSWPYLHIVWHCRKSWCHFRHHTLFSGGRYADHQLWSFDRSDVVKPPVYRPSVQEKSGDNWHLYAGIIDDATLDSNDAQGNKYR